MSFPCLLTACSQPMLRFGDYTSIIWPFRHSERSYQEAVLSDLSIETTEDGACVSLPCLDSELLPGVRLATEVTGPLSSPPLGGGAETCDAGAIPRWSASRRGLKTYTPDTIPVKAATRYGVNRRDMMDMHDGWRR